MLLLVRLTYRRTALAELLGEEPTPIVGVVDREDPDTGEITQEEAVVDWDYSACVHWDRPGDIIGVLPDDAKPTPADCAACLQVQVDDVPDARSDPKEPESSELGKLLYSQEKPRLDVDKLRAARTKGGKPDEKLVLPWIDASAAIALDAEAAAVEAVKP